MGYEFMTDGPVECECCGELYPESAVAGTGCCAECDYWIAEYDRAQAETLAKQKEVTQ